MHRTDTSWQLHYCIQQLNSARMFCGVLHPSQVPADSWQFHLAPRSHSKPSPNLNPPMGVFFMPHHFTKNTVQASIFCERCMKMTPWKVADGRRQFCLVCYDNRKAEDATKPVVEVTQALFSEK